MGNLTAANTMVPTEGSESTGEQRMASTVYLLWFVAKDDQEDDNGLLIGVYQTESNAQSAIERLRNKPGFADYPEGFQIHSRELDQDSWSEGFVETGA
jgi:hypothetical protein